MNGQEDNRNTNKNGSSKKKSRYSVSHILGGGILTEDFISKQFWLLVLIAALCLVFIGNRYDCLKKISEIEDLSKRLKDVKYESLVISTELTMQSRESQIETLLERKGLELSGSKMPPYEIKK